jgi:hypothetical protein
MRVNLLWVEFDSLSLLPLPLPIHRPLLPPHQRRDFLPILTHYPLLSSRYKYHQWDGSDNSVSPNTYENGIGYCRFLLVRDSLLLRGGCVSGNSSLLY